ncbi:iron chaperone [Luteolibacter marinus]|uniref:iron chaperone n=1 Tax=Luteolibacter marinus TaxID=2776705 RepID=UPI0018690DAC|nr:DUF1801 domain-containing protein [Luteolibacter marinus]
MKAPGHITTAEEYLAWVPEPRRAALTALHELILKAAPSLTPAIVHGMIGYGPARDRTKNGGEGEWFTIGLANQKRNMSLYFCAVEDGVYLAEGAKERLGKVSVGKSCVRFTRLEHLDLAVVGELVKRAAALGPCRAG